MQDVCLTLSVPAEATFTEKRSRFLAFAYPIDTPDDALALVSQLRKKYYDARHVCFAYVTGFEGETFRAVDDGEPSGTAGRPILGQIRSAGLSFVLVAVVRYFGGIQLGASGLGVAYKTAAALALQDAQTCERTVTADLLVEAPYTDVDYVMRTAREVGAAVVAQDYGPTSESLTLRIRASQLEALRQRLALQHTLSFPEP